MPRLSPLSRHEQDSLRETMAARVVAARKELGVSQRGMARALGMSASWAREVEHARQWPPAYLIAALARATGREPGWFYGGRSVEDVAARLLAAVAGLVEVCQ